jgi:peptidyl-prolyl cis-trans isomerase SurA
MAVPFLVLAFSLLLAGCNRGPSADVAATVNGYRITRAEVERHYQNQLREMSETPSEDEARMLRLNLVRELIDRELMLQRAEKLGLMAVDSEVEDSLKSYRAPFASQAEFENHLRERGLSLDDLRNELRRSLTVVKLFNKEITSTISVTDDEIRAYFEQNKAMFHQPEQQFHLAQILVTPRAEVPVPNRRNDDAIDAATAQQKIEMLEQRLKNGEDFDTLAQEYSEDPDSTPNGGDLGFLPQSSLGESNLTLRRVVASLSPGEVSPVIKTGDQFRILKLISIEPAGQRDYSDPRVQQTIRDTLTRTKDQLLKAAYLEVARNKAKVENFIAREVTVSFGIAD